MFYWKLSVSTHVSAINGLLILDPSPLEVAGAVCLFTLLQDYTVHNLQTFESDVPNGDDSSLPVCSASCTVHLQLFTNIVILLVRTRRDDSSLPVCSISCTVHLQLFTNIDIL